MVATPCLLGVLTSMHHRIVPLSHISSRPARSVLRAAETSPIINATGKMRFQIKVIGYCVDMTNSVAPGAWAKRVSSNETLDIYEARRALNWDTECCKLVNKGHSWWTLEQRRVYARTLIGDAKVFEVPQGCHLRELIGIKVKPTPEESSTGPAVHFSVSQACIRENGKPWYRLRREQNKPPGAKRFMADASRMCTGRAFFHTKQDHIGLAPYGVRQNDIVCFLGQATVPFILRPSQASKQPGHAPVYHLLGEGYTDEFTENCAPGIIPREGRRRPFITE